MLDVRDAEGGATLRVRVSPRASRDALGGEREGALVVRVTAAPVDGAANAALARLLARVLHVPASAVEVRHGGSGRDKLLHVTGLDARALLARLDSAGGGALR
jgi:uncharacterized protein YggU (UPF0235/DUF167 family)